MKKSILTTILVIPMILFACDVSEEENGRYVPVDNLAGSISYRYDTTTEVYKNGQLLDGESKWMRITINKRSDDRVSIRFSAAEISVAILESMLLTGKPYDVQFDHTSSSDGYISDVSFDNATMHIKGWMHNEQYASRDSPSMPSFDCDIECTISLETDIYSFKLTRLFGL